MKHGIGDCFFVLCWNAAILSFLFILTKFQIKGNYLLGHCLIPVSFQSTFDLFSLMCNISNRVVFSSSKTSTGKKTSWRKFVRSAPRNLSASLGEFMRMRVGWCNIMLMTVMLVTCAIKRRNGTRTKRDVQRHLRYHFYIYLQIGIYSDLAVLCYYKVFSFRVLLAICFTLFSLHLRHE